MHKNQREEFEKAFNYVAKKMYRETIANHPELEGFYSCGIDLRTPEGLVKIAASINQTDRK